MGLVPQTLDQVQGGRCGRQQDRHGRPRQEQLLAFLGQSRQGQVVQAELVEDLLGGADLALAAVDDHEIRHRPAEGLLGAFVAVLRPPEAAPEDLLVGGEVVGSLDGPDLEPAIFARPRPALLEHHHAPDRVRALDVRDVVALDPERRPGEPQRLGQLLEGAQGLALVGHPAGLLAGERLAGIAGGEGHELALLAALGHGQPRRAAPPGRQERLEVGGVGQERGDQHGRRDRGRPGVELEEERRQDLLVGRLAGRVQEEDVAADHLAAADREQLDRRLVVLPGEADEIELGPLEGGHLLALHRPLDRPDLVAHGRRAFVIGPLGRGLHVDGEGLDDRFLAALEEQLDLVDLAAVLGLRDGLDAGALAALDVVEEARSGEGPLAVLDVDRAGPEREEAPDEVHGLVDGAGRRIRPEIAAAVLDELAGPLDAREVVRLRDLDVGVALVVLEPDVEARPVALDQVGFEEEGLADRIGDRVLDVLDLLDDRPDPVDLAGRRRLLPVAPDAAAEARRLADVDHIAARVAHQVDAGPVGQLVEGRLELGGHAPMLGHPANGRGGRSPRWVVSGGRPGGAPATRPSGSGRRGFGPRA